MDIFIDVEICHCQRRGLVSLKAATAPTAAAMTVGLKNLLLLAVASTIGDIMRGKYHPPWYRKRSSPLAPSCSPGDTPASRSLPVVF